jgi:hypothetical protein
MVGPSPRLAANADISDRVRTFDVAAERVLQEQRKTPVEPQALQRAGNGLRRVLLEFEDELRRQEDGGDALAGARISAWKERRNTYSTTLRLATEQLQAASPDLTIAEWTPFQFRLPLVTKPTGDNSGSGAGSSDTTVTPTTPAATGSTGGPNPADGAPSLAGAGGKTGSQAGSHVSSVVEESFPAELRALEGYLVELEDRLHSQLNELKKNVSDRNKRRVGSIAEMEESLQDHVNVVKAKLADQSEASRVVRALRDFEGTAQEAKVVLHGLEPQPLQTIAEESAAN